MNYNNAKPYLIEQISTIAKQSFEKIKIFELKKHRKHTNQDNKNKLKQNEITKKKPRQFKNMKQ